jgi:hypothetical protein
LTINSSEKTLRKFSLSPSLSLANLVALAAMAAPTAISESARVTRAPQGKAVRRIQPRFTGRRYPEQSTRQALRLHRRAQGGLGIVLVDGMYEPKATFDDYLPR